MAASADSEDKEAAYDGDELVDFRGDGGSALGAAGAAQGAWRRRSRGAFHSLCASRAAPAGGARCAAGATPREQPSARGAGAAGARAAEGELPPGDARLGRHERAVACLFLGALCASALVGSVVLLLPCAALLLPPPLRASRALFRRAANAVAAAWFTLASALIERLALVRLRVSGPGGCARPEGERVAILLCNHTCRLDWLFLWPLACRLLCAGRLKVALKEDLRRVPLFGWAMQAFLFVFISRRDRALDLRTIETTLSYLTRQHDQPLLLLLFPEGTDLSPQALARDRAYAERTGGKPYARVLHPRTAGFAAAVRALGGRLDAVYDATLWYERHPAEAAAGARPSEASLLRGTFPRSVHVHVERYGADSLPHADDEAGLGAWLEGRWAAKEELLERQLSRRAPPPPARRPRPGLGVEYGLALAGWGCGVALLACACCARPRLLGYILGGCAALALLTASPIGGLDKAELALSGAGRA